MAHNSDGLVNSPPTPAAVGMNVGKYRRNGKLQSCEPCRKSKLKCDHTIPTCGRCVKRRCVEQCVYHPNPLTQQNRQSPRRQLSAPKRALPTPSLSTRGHTPSPSLNGAELAGPSYQAASQETIEEQQSPEQQSNRAASAPPLHTDNEDVVERGSGFLGDNTFRSIFKESLGSLGVVLTDLDSSKITNAPVASDRVAQGCQALSFLKERSMVNSFISHWFEVGEGVGVIATEPMVKGWLQKLWLYHGDVLEAQDPEKLFQLSKQVWRNTQIPIRVDGNTTASEWIDLATGPNIRWGVIGLIAAIMGNCATYMDASHSIFKEHHNSRQTISNQLNAISRACLSFCRECDALDDIFIHLLIEDMCLTSALKGDSSHTAYRAIGEILDTIVSLGWHQEIKVNDRVPFFLVELRKRARANAYFAESGSSSFLGRPPRASHRYWNLESPSDLTDKEIMLDPREVESILASHDANGFNKTEQLRRGTWLRAWIGFATRREDILDLALGHYTVEEIKERAEIISRKIEEHWKLLPEYMQRARHEKFLSPQQPLRTLCLTVLRQGTRANDLLLQRVLIRKAGASSERLIKLAQTIFKDVLEFSQRQEFMTTFQLDVTSILVVHGLRASAIIAVELLKQEQLASYPSEPLLPRSQTIQELSVFAARLGAVDSSDGMYNMCQQGRKVITRILDKILAPPSASVEQQAPTSRAASSTYPQQQGCGQMDVDMNGGGICQGVTCMAPMGAIMPMDFSFPAHDPTLSDCDDTVFMQWLESIDWERQGVWGGL